MNYNPFMPSVKLNSRITFGGGGGDGAPAPVTPTPAVEAPTPPPPPVFKSTYPELSGQEFPSEDAKVAAEKTVDSNKVSATTAGTTATEYAKGVGNDVSTASKNVQNTISTLQLELNSLLTADQANPQIASAVAAKQEAITKAQAELSNLSGIQQTQMVQSQQDLMRNTLINPGSVLQKAQVSGIDPSATGTQIDPATGQIPNVPVGQTTSAVATPMAGPADITAAGIAASTGASGTAQNLQGLTAQQGTVSPQGTIAAATMDPTTTGVGNLTAQQGTAVLMDNPVQREIQAGELISGAADAVKASAFTEQIQAATATPSDKATVQGQLTNLMEDFEDGVTPTWAAGAMRTATAQMAARGLGASSMAGQAIVQAAMESALPIAAADAQVFAQFENQNLSNKQARAMLAAQQRASFIGIEFDQEFQSRVANASRISEVANLNFTAEQQIGLENSRSANTINLANLTNKQAMVMAEASSISQIEQKNLTNQQQASVQNAQNFLGMEMANLTNRQSTEVFKAQAMQQTLLTDVAAENAAKQFNSTSENQTKQFLASLNSQVSQFNSSQSAAISQFNAGQENANTEFVTKMQEQRNQFNSTNSLAIAQANAVWRQNVSTLNSAADNASNMEFAKITNGLTAKSIDEIWQRERDIMDMFFNSEESSKDRTLSLMVADKDQDAARMQLEYAEERDKTSQLMKFFWPF